MESLPANRRTERLWLLARHRRFLSILSATNYIGSPYSIYKYQTRLPVNESTLAITDINANYITLDHTYTQRNNKTRRKLRSDSSDFSMQRYCRVSKDR
jgi:hypothetical protein